MFGLEESHGTLKCNLPKEHWIIVAILTNNSLLSSFSCLLACNGSLRVVSGLLVQMHIAELPQPRDSPWSEETLACCRVKKVHDYTRY